MRMTTVGLSDSAVGWFLIMTSAHVTTVAPWLLSGATRQLLRGSAITGQFNFAAKSRMKRGWSIPFPAIIKPRSARSARDNFLRSDAVATSALIRTGECESTEGSASATPTSGSRNGKFT